jgi:hypothetical protein
MFLFKLALANTKISQRIAPHMSKPGITLEVERKFNPTAASLSHFRKNAGPQSFSSHDYLGCKPLKDVYFEAHEVVLMQ